jgi:hypothetical protein
MMLEKVAVQVVSKIQKIYIRILTKAELIAFGNVVVTVLLTQLFLEEHGFEIDKNVFYHDITAAM